MDPRTPGGAARPVDVPEGWRGIVEQERAKPYFRRLAAFLEEEEREHEIFPGRPQRFAALELTPYDRASVLILGQDPYPSPGHAHGLCFSVPPDVAPPPSLRNIFQELRTDLGVEPPASGCLDSWARQGVLLLNAVLTVRSGAPASHRGRGWERFTDVLIRHLAERPDPVVFVLWGKEAQRKRHLISGARHTILEAPHPSPLSAWRGFLGSRPFSRINRALRDSGQPEIDWAAS